MEVDVRSWSGVGSLGLLSTLLETVAIDKSDVYQGHLFKFYSPYVTSF